LLCIALGYLFRVIELARGLKAEKEWVPTEHDNRMMGRMFLVFMLCFIAWSLYQVYIYGYRSLPKSASEHGVKVDELMKYNMYIIWFVFIVTNFVLFYFAWKYYGRKTSKAVFFAHDNKLEMIWTVVPALVLAFIIIFGLKYWNEIMDRSTDPKAIKIELYSKQFDWTARYTGADNTFGIDDYTQIDGGNSMGLDTTDSKCFDDIIVKNEIHIPVGREVDFQFRSRDVIHSAFMPHFRAQMNCVPGQVTKFKFKPTVTTEEMRKDPQVIRNINEINAIRAKRGEDPFVFDYVLICNKICGASHFNMQMKIVVDTPADYEAWLKKQPAFKKDKLVAVKAD
jgi:cytochrome c oxidase subunit 2